MTFSIIAYDPEVEAWGIAAASRTLAAGGRVMWARSGAGVVATQAKTRVSFGADGVALLAEGVSARAALEQLLAADPLREQRQVALIDRDGAVAVHTGVECIGWAGHQIGERVAIQGNFVAGPQVIESMASAFAASSGALPDRLVAALRAGDAAGGDARGRRSAGLLVVRSGAGQGGDHDRWVDLRIDDDPDPVARLILALRRHHLVFESPAPSDQVEFNTDVIAEMQAILCAQGFCAGQPNGQWNDDWATGWAAYLRTDDIDAVRYAPADGMVNRRVIDYVRTRAETR